MFMKTVFVSHKCVTASPINSTNCQWTLIYMNINVNINTHYIKHA